MTPDKPNIDKMESEWDIEGLVEALGYKTEKRPEDDSVQLILEDDKVHHAAFSALEKFGNDAVQPLVNGLKSKKSAIRFQAAILLGNLGDLHAVEPLIVLLQKEKNASLRSVVAGALGKIGDPRAVEPLKKSLENERQTGGYGNFLSKYTKALEDIQIANHESFLIKVDYDPRRRIVDAMLGICAHNPEILLTPPSDIKNAAENSLSRGISNASLSIDAKTGYIITQGGDNFTTVEQNAKKDLPNQMFNFMLQNRLEENNYEIKYFSENLRDDIRVFWASAVRKK